jgi:hypothetical protein
MGANRLRTYFQFSLNNLLGLLQSVRTRILESRGSVCVCVCVCVCGGDMSCLFGSLS